MKLTIYTSNLNTKRLQFVAEHIFNRILGIDFQLTNDKNFYLSQAGNQIWYADEKPKTGLHIIPQGLLFETNIHSIDDLQTAKYHNLFCFFYSEKGDIPFDLFSATFYRLSLYEEYLPHITDVHGRFRHQDSLLFQNDVLEIPVIDRWAYFLKEELIKLGASENHFSLRKFRFISTYDIDFPYLYRYKSLIKNTLGFLRDIFLRKWDKAKERYQVLLHRITDPYLSAIENIERLHQEHHHPYYLFVLLGKSGRFGHSNTYNPKDYHRHISQLKNVEIGLHPSYKTLYHPEILQKEKAKLEKTVKREMTCSRQHFLRMHTPETFRDLLANGFWHDFSLSFAHASGFRSGTAIPHPFFDLQKNETSDLLLHPTVFMDSTFVFHQKQSPEEVEKKIRKLIDECKKSGGDYLSLWHNSNLSGNENENLWINTWFRTFMYAKSTEND